MASLLKLADTKANKPGMNLMHYVAKVRRSSGMDRCSQKKVLVKKPAIMLFPSTVM